MRGKEEGGEVGMGERGKGIRERRTWGNFGGQGGKWKRTDIGHKVGGQEGI